MSLEFSRQLHEIFLITRFLSPLLEIISLEESNENIFKLSKANLYKIELLEFLIIFS